MNYVIHDGIEVVNITIGEPSDLPEGYYAESKTGEWIDACICQKVYMQSDVWHLRPDQPGDEYIWDNTINEWVLEIELLREKKLKDLTREFLYRMNRGITVNGHPLSSGNKETLRSIGFLFITGRTNPHGGYFKFDNNEILNLSDVQMQSIVENYNQMLMHGGRTLHDSKSTIKSMVTIEELQSFDVYSDNNWPQYQFTVGGS